MKIAQVCHVYLPHMGGIEFFADRLGESLIERKIEATIITTDMKTSLDNRKKSAFYYKAWFSFLGNPFAPSIAKHFIKNKYDLIQLHSVWFLPSLFAAVFRKNTKIITIIHGVYPDKATKIQKLFIWLYKPFAKYVASKSKWVLVQSYSEKEKTIKYLKVNPDKIKVIYNGIILEKNRRKVKNKDKVILFTGRIIPDKNPDLLIKAGSILKKAGYKFKIKFIGTIDEGYKKKLISLADSLGVSKEILFVPNISKEKRMDLMREYASSFTCIAVGSWEGLPNRLMEAMQFGIPCIAYPSGGTAELIQDEKTGLLIKKLDEEELAEKIELLIKNRTLYNVLGRNGKKIVETQFNWNNVFEKILSAYVNE